MSYKNTVIQILAASSSSPYNSKFLKVGSEQDALVGVVDGQDKASLFTKYALWLCRWWVSIRSFDRTGAFVSDTGITGFGVAGGPQGFRTGYVDTLSHKQPVLMATNNRLVDEPFAGPLGCNTFPADDSSGKNRLGCAITQSTAAFQYGAGGTGWAICGGFAYGYDSLWIYDPNFFTNGPPKDCDAVQLLVVAAPNSS